MHSSRAKGIRWLLVALSLGVGACSDEMRAAVAPSISGPATPLADGKVGVAISSVTFTASGTSPISWSVTSGSLPPGLMLDAASGRYSGTPTTAGTYAFTVSARNGAGTDSRPYSQAILAPPAITGPASPLTAGTVGAPFGPVTFAASGSTPISWSVSSGSLPPGLSLDAATGVYSGTPTAPGSFTFEVTATNGAGASSSSYSQEVTVPAPNATVLLSDNRLAGFNTVYPAGLSAPAAVVGLNAGDVLVSIDRRPQNGFLYGLGFNPALGTVQLYAVHPTTALAVAIGSTGTFVDGTGAPVLVGAGAGGFFGIDFNPTVDRIRVVTSAGQNFRINPNTGAFVDGNPAVNGLNMDGAINGAVTSVTETAYTNNALNAAVTTQYTLDPVSDQLCIQNPPNNGTQGLCRSLSTGVDAVLGFDILPGVDTATSGMPVASGTGLAVIRLSGQTTETLATIDLDNGTVSPVGVFGSPGIVGLALQQPASAAVVGLSADGAQLVRFPSATPGTSVAVNVGPLAAGEVLIGIDWRPQTGQLFGLGIQAATATGTLYLLDPQTAAVTAVGSAGQVALVDSTGMPVPFPSPQGGYGFDFNPTVDRIRVVTGSGLNFRINPGTGAPVDGNASPADGINPDGALNGLPPGSTGVTGAAYTNSYGQPLSGGVTTQYVLDPGSDRLLIQNPPNAGTVNGGVAVTLNGSALDFGAANGFDIPAQVRTMTSGTPVASGTGLAALSVGGSTHLYAIDLVSGAATDLGGVTPSLGGLAVGQTAER